MIRHSQNSNLVIHNELDYRGFMYRTLSVESL